jgi:hypothetical protein
MAQATYGLDHVKARWAYSELLSSNIGHLYNGVEWLKERASQGTAFEDLASSDVAVLVQMFDGVRGGYFNDYYFTGVTRFRLAHWTKNELGAAHVIPHFLPPRATTMTFEEWIGIAPATPGDPRQLLGSSRPFNQVDPLTVVRDAGATVLLDGYHRSCRFWGQNDAPTLVVYVPV